MSTGSDAGGTAAELLAALVAIPSPSGEEGAAARLLMTWGETRGLDATMDESAVRMVVQGRRDGPTLLLASHLDTVPPGEGWTVDPSTATLRDGRLYGRGAVDAKASVAAMAAALHALAGQGGPQRGRVVLLATYAEETRDTTMPEALRRLGGLPDAAIVGEPTSLEPCIAQRGQLLLRLTWRGEQLHAGWAAGREPRPVNAIERAAADLTRLAALRFPRRHAILGEVAISPTTIEAGVARNVTPPSCAAVLDVRTTPEYGHAEIVEAVAAAVGAGVEVLSDRLRPVETPEGSRLLAAVVRALPSSRPFGSPTCSDWVWLAGADAVKLGPGDSRRSHTPDEWIAVDEVERAAAAYVAIAREYLP